MHLSTPEQINAYRLATLRTGLRLEIKGMRISKGATCYALLKAMGFTGTRQQVLDQATQAVADIKGAM